MNHMKYRLAMIMICLMLSLTGCIHIHHTVPSEGSTAANTVESVSQTDTEGTAEESAQTTESEAAEKTTETSGKTTEASEKTAEASEKTTETTKKATERAAQGTAESTAERTAESSSERTGKKEDKTSASKESSKARETGKDGLLTKDEAIAIVIKRVKGAKPSHIRSIELDHEDGRWQYEGELVYKGIEYEFEIDAQNGNILDWEIDD
ncbi:MAG: PepSY domain-containing protein [Lachnospiraceae bacterium]